MDIVKSHAVQATYAMKRSTQALRNILLASFLAIAPACRDATRTVPVLNEPAGPMEVIEAGCLFDGGTQFASLRDARGQEYSFAITPYSRSLDIADRRTNRRL